ncbi:hypothetical protein [Lapillicoccus jejuensis]|uniref:Uncharacterized protein n=1 Tax=Lapillicoccus jejuensis TaxID=402171 RepID=A0A542DXW5_9MICO|nr:hypothetical protein [Lapillicoccus jejuensis]TQJ07928.1 hypothetical protein FB458_1000 [Lapillicoccus jejuensis]
MTFVAGHAEGGGTSASWSVHGPHLLLLGAWVLVVAVALVRGAGGGPLPRRDVRLWVAAGASVVSAAVHLAVVPEHLEESWLYGAFFLVLTLLQVAWAALAVRRPTPRLLLAGAVASGLVALLWAATRTVGIPLGPSAGEVEAVGLADVVATLTEVLVVACVAWVLASVRSARLSMAGGAPVVPGRSGHVTVD